MKDSNYEGQHLMASASTEMSTAHTGNNNFSTYKALRVMNRALERFTKFAKDNSELSISARHLRCAISNLLDPGINATMTGQLEVLFPIRNWSPWLSKLLPQPSGHSGMTYLFLTYFDTLSMILGRWNASASHLFPQDVLARSCVERLKICAQSFGEIDSAACRAHQSYITEVASFLEGSSSTVRRSGESE